MFLLSTSNRLLDSGTSTILFRSLDEFDLSALPAGPLTLDFTGNTFSSTEDGSQASAMVQIFGFVADGQPTMVNRDGSFDSSEFFGGTLLETITVDTTSSEEFSIPVTDFLDDLRAQNEQFAGFRFQLLTADRSGVVGVPVLTVTTPFILGDVNGDGQVSFLDISGFISLLANGDFQVEADIDGNGVVSFLDIDPFIGLLSGQ